MKQILKQCNVLLVEDELKTRQQIEEALLIYVKKVYVADNGQEALNIYYKENIDIVFTDVKMPIMDGLSLTKVIRNENKKIPIVVISAYTQKELLLDFMSKNLVCYMVKPVNFKDFTQVLYQCAQTLEECGLIETPLGKNIKYSYSKKMLIKEDKFISLAPKEILFIELILKNNNKLVTKEQIENEVWNNDGMTQAALNNLVAKIRKKTFSAFITNVSTLGFMFVKQE